MDERTEPRAAFALRLVADLLCGLMLKGVLSKEELGALVTDSLNASLQSDPQHEDALREIAGVIVAQAGLAKMDLDRKLDRP
jgi:hypothetical protein